LVRLPTTTRAPRARSGVRNAHGVAIVESITRRSVSWASAGTSCARVSGLVNVSANTICVVGRIAAASPARSPSSTSVTSAPIRRALSSKNVRVLL
jgi:hypothetical protein